MVGDPYQSQIGLRDEDLLPQRDLLDFFGTLGVPALGLAPHYRDLRGRTFVDDYMRLSPHGHAVVAGVMQELLEDQLPAEHSR